MNRTERKRLVFTRHFAWRAEPAGLFPTEDHVARAVLSTVAAVPDAPSFGRALQEDGAPEILRRIQESAGGNEPGWVSAAVRLWERPETRAVLLDADLPARAADAGVRFLIPGARDWPRWADDLGDQRPCGLWVRGRVELLHSPRVAIVGARNCTPYGQQVAESLAGSLAGSGWAVVSGGARGIDTAAHAGALRRGVPTVVMLPCGLNVTYPPENAKLFTYIARHGGLLVSEVGPGRRQGRALFFSRNRLVAASDATIVAEAAAQSGTMHTADITRRLERPLLAVPGPITSPASAGPNQLIAKGLATTVQEPGAIPGMLAELAP